VTTAFAAAPTIHITAVVVSFAGLGRIFWSGILPAPSGLLNIIRIIGIVIAILHILVGTGTIF